MPGRMGPLGRTAGGAGATLPKTALVCANGPFGEVAPGIFPCGKANCANGSQNRVRATLEILDASSLATAAADDALPLWCFKTAEGIGASILRTTTAQSACQPPLPSRIGGARQLSGPKPPRCPPLSVGRRRTARQIAGPTSPRSTATGLPPASPAVRSRYPVRAKPRPERPRAGPAPQTNHQLHRETARGKSPSGRVGCDRRPLSVTITLPCP